MTLNEILDRCRKSQHSAAWGDIAAALLDMFPDLECGYEGAFVSTIPKEEPSCVRIPSDVVGVYEPNLARGLATSILRCADEADAQRKLLPNI